ncbi:MAG: hypothetical protein WEB88_01900 [Gemmatimonadota bacterium]
MAKGGRSAFERAVPSFFVPASLLALCLAPGTLAAQGPRLEFRLGVVASSALARDEVASTLLRQRVAAPVSREVLAGPRPAPALEMALQLPLRPGLAAELALGYSRSALGVEEAEGSSWDAGNLYVLQGLLGIRWQWRPGVGVSGAFGALRYGADGRAFFAAGGEMNPGIETALDVRLPWHDGRTGVRAFAQVHGFNTPALRRAGAADGGVMRFGVQVTQRFFGGRGS